MRDAEPKTIRLRDYRPPAMRITDVALAFDIQPGTTTVTSTLDVERVDPDGSELRLDGEELELVSVELDGEPLSENAYRLDDEGLTLYDLPARCRVRIVNRIHPEENTALEGLYRSGGMYCTQCEAEGFRKITFYQDRPDVLARFTTTITAPAEYPILLSNGNPVGEITLDDGRREVTWEDPFPKPSYLFALVAGDLAVLEDAFTTASGRDVQLRIYSEPHNIDKCGYAMEALKRAMRWDEERFGREYDLDIFMIVAVDDFNMGAMENKGLNIFNTSCVLAAPDMATDLAYQRVEAVVAHEYFHNWSGDRVTCRDWFQLSLKEGFTVFRDAEFSSDMNSRTVKRIEDVNFLRSVQFAEDASPLSHPIRPDSYIEISNFYTPTVYEKGAEVIRMLHTILGPDAFRRGSDLYFERHDGEAATTDDFVAAMAEASGRDLDLFKRWYSQAGTPELSVRSRWDDGRLTLSITQSCPPTPGQPVKKPLQVPIAMGLIAPDGTPLALDELKFHSDMTLDMRGDTLVLELTAAQAVLEVDGLAEEPEVSLLRGFSAPVRVDFPRSEASLGVLAVHDPDGFAAWDALQTLLVQEVGAYAERGEISAGVVELYSTLLDQALDVINAGTDETRFMLAAKLSVPDEGYLFEHFATVDVDAVISARDALRRALATRLQARWKALYDAGAPERAYTPDPRGMSRRALRNLALAYLAEASSSAELGALVERHYREADNLTERRAALVAAVNIEALAGIARPILEDFYGRFEHEALAVNQWLSIQATSRLADAATVQALASSSAFDLRNPNKVRSVYGAFAQANLRNFHASDGSGYRLVGEAVRMLNVANPQIASALAKPLTRWRRFAGRRPALMRAVLEDLAREENLSRDVFEVVSKGLADD